MSRFIDQLNLRQTGSQSIGFRARQPASAKAKLRLVASLARESAEGMADSLAGADAGLIHLSQLSTSAKVLNELAQATEIPWGIWLPDNATGEEERLVKADADFIVFPTSAPLAPVQDEKVGKILEVETSISEGLLRAANEMPIDAVLVTRERKEDHLTWQELMFFRRFADLLTRPFLVSIPSKVTSEGLQALWDAGVKGVVVEMMPEQPQRMRELQNMIDQLTPPAHRRERPEPLLPRTTQEPDIVAEEEEEE